MYQVGNLNTFSYNDQTIFGIRNELIEACYAENDLGLNKGKTGILLALYKISNSLNETDNLMIKNAIRYIQEEISANAGKANDSFSDGIFGIGWAINTLYEQGYLTENETEVMNSFDDELYKLVMYQKSSTHDLETGTIGRINYYLKRISENLKVSNKYRYVCNYECLMLLVDDFTGENEKILNKLQSDKTCFELLTNNGKFYSTIFNLLLILVDKNIHFEITQKQQLQFLKFFVDYLSFIKENDSVIYTSKKIYWNLISLSNCILNLAVTNSALEKRVKPFKFFFKKMILEILYPASDIKQLANQICFYQLNNYSNLENCFENIDISNFSLGLNGFSGLLYLFKCLEDNKFSVINNAFLI